MKTHARNTVNTRKFKDCIFHGKKPKRAKTLEITMFLIKKRVNFRLFIVSNASQKQERGYPPTPFQILNFKMLQDVCNKQLLTPKTRPEPHFLTVFTMFYVRTPFFTQKNATSKKTNNHILLVFSFLGLPPLAPNRPLPRAIFDSICDVLCTSSTLQKRAVFLPRGGVCDCGTSPYIAKAKATPHAMRSNMPGIRCLVHRRILTG